MLKTIIQTWLNKFVDNLVDFMEVRGYINTNKSSELIRDDIRRHIKGEINDRIGKIEL